MVSKTALEAVTGETLARIGRALDMAIFSFGAEIPWVNAFGESETRARFAFHVQCSFRLTRKMRAILEDGDMRRGLSDTAAGELRKAGWHLDDEPPTVFDAKVYSLGPVLKAERPTVQSVEIASDGDVSIFLSGDVMLQVKPPKPAGQEAWRFFDRLSDQAVVFPS